MLSGINRNYANEFYQILICSHSDFQTIWFVFKPSYLNIYTCKPEPVNTSRNQTHRLLFPLLITNVSDQYISE